MYVYISFSFCIPFADEDTKNPCAQFLVTNETNTAAFGDLRHIINFDTETICVDFESPIGKQHKCASIFVFRRFSLSRFNFIQCDCCSIFIRFAKVS